jgi:DNA-binding transcriptional LysR family regulator
LRLNRASLRREPETAGRYSFNHTKVARIPLCVVWRKSSDNPAVTAFLDILRASRPKIRKQMENLIRQSNEAA